MPWRLASAHVIRPSPLSSHLGRAQRRRTLMPQGARAQRAPRLHATCSSVESHLRQHGLCRPRFGLVDGEVVLSPHLDRALRQTSRRCLQASTRPHPWRASDADSRTGEASVRLARSDANARLSAADRAHMPLSCASEVATMCSMSVWPSWAKQVPV